MNLRIFRISQLVDFLHEFPPFFLNRCRDIKRIRNILRIYSAHLREQIRQFGPSLRIWKYRFGPNLNLFTRRGEKFEKWNLVKPPLYCLKIKILSEFCNIAHFWHVPGLRSCTVHMPNDKNSGVLYLCAKLQKPVPRSSKKLLLFMC